MPDRLVAPLVLDAIDYVYARLRERLTGLTEDEYLWEPVAGCWSVRQGADGAWAVERPEPEPQPPPVTTIAWRLWHLASECFAGYTESGLGPRPIRATGLAWHGDVATALDDLDTAWQGFRAGLDRLGEDGLWAALGERWGPFANDSWAALVLHAQDELSHHGAELALLRDLYARR